MLSLSFNKLCLSSISSQLYLYIFHFFVEEAAKSESKDEATPASTFEILNDIASLHNSALQKLQVQHTFVNCIGPHRRALCARKDLKIRQQLCSIFKVGS